MRAVIRICNALLMFILAASWTGIFLVILVGGKFSFGEPDLRILIAEYVLSLVILAYSLGNLIAACWRDK